MDFEIRQQGRDGKFSDGEGLNRGKSHEWIAACPSRNPFCPAAGT